MIKKYKQFNESLDFPYNKEKIHELCKEYSIENYIINDDMSIDVDGYIILSYENLDKFPVRFNKVYGYFQCNNNKLESLEGCPKEVSGYFDCSSNRLTSLEGMPNYISGVIYCHGNNIKSFKGIPEDFDETIYCFGNPVYEVYKLFGDKPNNKAIYWLNEYDVIKGDNIIMDRLEEVFAQIGITFPVLIEDNFIHYNLI